MTECKIAYMANQIATFFDSRPPDQRLHESDLEIAR